MIDFSIIIPQRGAVDTLPRLLNSIPRSERIEIIIVDNTPTPISKKEVSTDREFELLWSSPDRHAGGARNVGLQNSHGKWIVFADADDYFAEGAFDVFYKHLESDADVIYYGMTGIYNDTGQYSNRGEKYNKMISSYLDRASDEYSIRLWFHSPCSKMIKKELILKHGLQFDEVRASNDVFFSTTAGFYASKIEAYREVVYVATVSAGSLTRSRSSDVINSRFQVTLKRNQFLRKNKLSEHQGSVLIYFYLSRGEGIRYLYNMTKMLVRFKQNPFVGWSKWFSHYIRFVLHSKKEKEYIRN